MHLESMGPTVPRELLEMLAYTSVVQKDTSEIKAQKVSLVCPGPQDYKDCQVFLDHRDQRVTEDHLGYLESL